MNDLKTVVRYFEMRWEGKTDFDALAMCDRRDMERTALSALRDALQRQPDHKTGLVPCGCGGKAFVYCPVEMTDVFVIRCEKCRVGITFAMDLPRAKKEWNTAMGWRAEG